jgi:hypothetical protein
MFFRIDNQVSFYDNYGEKKYGRIIEIMIYINRLPSYLIKVKNEVINVWISEDDLTLISKL